MGSVARVSPAGRLSTSVFVVRVFFAAPPPSPFLCPGFCASRCCAPFLVRTVAARDDRRRAKYLQYRPNCPRAELWVEFLKARLYLLALRSLRLCPAA